MAVRNVTSPMLALSAFSSSPTGCLALQSVRVGLRDFPPFCAYLNEDTDMKRQFKLSVVGLSGLAVAAILYGQAASFKARIPFAFVAAGQLLAAGEYSFQSDVVPGLLLVKGQRGKETVVVKGLPLSPNAYTEHSKLVFNRYGDQYFLAEVWPPESSTGRQVPPCNRERELARQITPERASVTAAR
jgi:hypothetical protein